VSCGGRKVYRVAAGYAVAGWLFIQVAVTTFPVLTLPVWATRLVVFAVLGGFPIALPFGRLILDRADCRSLPRLP
jgi:hypothetical protein